MLWCFVTRGYPIVISCEASRSRGQLDASQEHQKKKKNNKENLLIKYPILYNADRCIILSN